MPILASHVMYGFVDESENACYGAIWITGPFGRYSGTDLYSSVKQTHTRGISQEALQTFPIVGPAKIQLDMILVCKACLFIATSGHCLTWRTP